jgi:hypothetical protein
MNMHFWYISHKYKNTHVPYFTHEMHCFASYFMCSHWRTIYIWYISHVYKTHVPYFIHKMHSFLAFSCIFTMFSLKKHVFLVYFTCIQKYTCNILHTWNAVFFKCFLVLSLCFLFQNMYILYIPYVFKNTHVLYFIHDMHGIASVFMCFHCIFTAKSFTFCIFQMCLKIHVYDTLYMKCTVLLVFLCISLKKHVLLVYFTYIQK